MAAQNEASGGIFSVEFPLEEDTATRLWINTVKEQYLYDNGTEQLQLALASCVDNILYGEEARDEQRTKVLLSQESMIIQAFGIPEILPEDAEGKLRRGMLVRRIALRQAQREADRAEAALEKATAYFF